MHRRNSPENGREHRRPPPTAAAPFPSIEAVSDSTKHTIVLRITPRPNPNHQFDGNTAGSGPATADHRGTAAALPVDLDHLSRN